MNRRLVVLIAVLLAAGIPAGPVRAEPGDQLPTIRGLVWDDRNRNGHQDEGEPGVKGVGVLVRGPSFPDGDAGAVRRAKALAMLRTLRPGQVAAFDPDIDVTQTDENGRYVFEQRRAGRNLLEVYGQVGPDFWRVSPLHQGDDRDADSDFTEEFNPYGDPYGGPPFYYGVAETTLASDSAVRLDAGLYSVPPPKKDVTVTGRAWNDRNRNGIQDPGESGISGLPVLVAGTPGPFVQARQKRAGAEPELVTDKDGRYEVKVYAGVTRVLVGSGPDESTPVWTFTAKGAGDDRSRDSDVAAGEHQPFWGYSDDAPTKAGARLVVDAGMYRDEPSPSTSPTPTSSPVPSPGTSSIPPSTTVPVPAPAPGGGGSLPTTGAAITAFLATGLGLLVAGGALIVLARRRRRVA